MADLSKSQQDTQKEKEMADGPPRNWFAMAMSSGWYGLDRVLRRAGARRTREGGAQIVGIPTSNATAELAKKVRRSPNFDRPTSGD